MCILPQFKKKKKKENKLYFKFHLLTLPELAWHWGGTSCWTWLWPSTHFFTPLPPLLLACSLWSQSARTRMCWVGEGQGACPGLAWVTEEGVRWGLRAMLFSLSLAHLVESKKFNHLHDLNPLLISITKLSISLIFDLPSVPLHHGINNDDLFRGYWLWLPR